jgi:hypothetical protein
LPGYFSSRFFFAYSTKVVVGIDWNAKWLKYSFRNGSNASRP